MSWSRILGHQHQIDAFRRVVQRRRLAHAYLFAGPAGVGKRLFAQEFAKALLCEAPEKPEDRLEACDKCPACTQVDAGTHPDLFTLQMPEESNEVPIELVQNLCAGFSMKSARGHGKVAILDDADDLNEESANCFLKTLEEPPPRSVFILVGTSLDRQLPTIQSRCHTVRFGPLTDDQVTQILRKCEIEGGPLLKRVVRLGGGSPGQALALADPALWDFRKKLLEELSRPKIDSMTLANSFVEFAEDAGKELPAQRRRASLMLRLLLEGFTDALNLNVGAKTKARDPDDLRLLHALQNRATPEKFMTLVERCLQAEQQIGRYVQLTLVLEGLLDALAQLLEDAQAAG
jgi:DNA polymerase III subunit delta'